MQLDIELLEKLGYNTNNKTTVILCDIISEVVDELSSKNDEEVRKLVEDKKSYLYTEIGCFVYEIGLNRLIKELERLHKKRNIESINIELYNDIFKEDFNPTIYDSIINIALYKKKNKSSNNKEYKKVKNRLTI